MGSCSRRGTARKRRSSPTSGVISRALSFRLVVVMFSNLTKVCAACNLQFPDSNRYDAKCEDLIQIQGITLSPAAEMFAQYQQGAFGNLRMLAKMPKCLRCPAPESLGLFFAQGVLQGLVVHCPRLQALHRLSALGTLCCDFYG